jgi:hypothetical protein
VAADVKRSISTFFKDPEPTEKFADVVPGVNVVDGIAKVDEPLRSPVRGQNCVAFFYRSFFVITGGRAPAIHKLKQAEVYAPFTLEMAGGSLEVVPAKPGKWEDGTHQRLQKEYQKGFQGTEEVIMPGAKVRLKGKVKEVGGQKVLKMKEMTVLKKQAVSAGVVGDRKARKKKGKKKKKKK